MLFTLIALGLALSLDSFAASFAIGSLTRSAQYHRSLALSFAFCDGLASWLGAAQELPHAFVTWIGWFGPVLAVGYALYVVALALVASRASPSKDRPWLLFGLPICLGLDNLVTGAATQSSAAAAALSAIAFGAASGAAALAGISLGTKIGRGIPAWAGWLGGVLLLIAAMP